MFKRLGRKRQDGELSDAELHRAALAGSGEAMAALYRRHGGLVYRFTLQMSRNEGVAEEITQEVFLALLTQMETFWAMYILVRGLALVCTIWSDEIFCHCLSSKIMTPRLKG